MCDKMRFLMSPIAIIYIFRAPVKGRQIQRHSSIINLQPLSLPLRKKMASNFHARSNSLPSRPHPVILQCNENLDRLRASREASPSSSLLNHKLQGLQTLHDCVEKLIQLPLTQEALVHEPQDELLDGSLRLLDACNAAKDASLHTKECMRELQSILRRKRGGEVEITVEVRNSWPQGRL